MTPLFAAIGFGLVVGIRALAGWDPILLWPPIITVAFLTAAPIGYLAGIGCFDYWIYYISGRPTRPEDHSSHGAQSWKDYLRVNTDHKVIGVQYIVTTIFFFIVGGLMAMVFRAELAEPGIQFVDPQTFNGLISVHASLMIFLFIIPAFAGLANYVVPLMLGAPDMAFPRLNALSFWMLPAAGVIMLASFFVDGGAFGAGWTGYAPLSVTNPDGNLFFQMGVQWAGASSIATALNFLVTIITMRAPGMTFWRMPLLVWANFTTSLLVVVATPFIAGVAVLRDVRPDPAHRLLPAGRGRLRARLPAHLLVLQPPGRLHHDAARLRDRLRGHLDLRAEADLRLPPDGAVADGDPLPRLLRLGAPHVRLGHGQLAARADDDHDAADRHPDRDQGLLVARDAVGGEAPSSRRPMLWALGFVSMFIIGGLSGIYLGAVPIDIHVSDTYFIVAHIHYVLFGGSVFTIFAGIYYWFPKMTGRMYNERLGKLHFWLTFVGFNAHVLPDALDRDAGDAAPGRRLLGPVRELELLHLALVVLPRHVHARLPLQHDHELGARPAAAGNPWRALTLEWQVTSPPPIFNFDEIPQVVGCPYEYGVPGARHALLNGDRAARADGGADSLMAEHLLVVANETAGTRAFVEAVKERAGGDDLVTVVAPVNAPRRGLRRLRGHAPRRRRAAPRPDPRRPARGRRSRRTGFVADAEPADAVRDALATVEPPVTQRLVSTHPQQRSGWLRRNVVDRIVRKAPATSRSSTSSSTSRRGGRARRTCS